MLEKLLLYDNQQPRPLIMLRNILMVRLIDYPKGVLVVMLGNGDKLFIKLFGITIQMKNLLLDVKFPTLLKDVKNLKVLLNI